MRNWKIEKLPNCLIALDFRTSTFLHFHNFAFSHFHTRTFSHYIRRPPSSPHPAAVAVHPSSVRAANANRQAGVAPLPTDRIRGPPWRRERGRFREGRKRGCYTSKAPLVFSRRSHIRTCNPSCLQPVSTFHLNLYTRGRASQRF